MDLHERRLAQIVRDFMEAYALSAQIGRRLQAGDLEFSWVKRLADESDESALYRLKEECHALFRSDPRAMPEEPQAEEIFDLAVGALFHEGMKFREGYYLTTTYGPKLDRMLKERSESAPLTKAFSRVFEAGRQRMLESEAEAAELFDETRDQLLVVIRKYPQSGAIARALVDDPIRTEQVFDVPVGALLQSIYGSSPRGYQIAVESLIESGHFGEAAALLERQESGLDEHDMSRRFARGMQQYYAGNAHDSVDYLGDWIEGGTCGSSQWKRLARRALAGVAETTREADSELASRAEALCDALNSR
jgi:hypothetical protein